MLQQPTRRQEKQKLRNEKEEKQKINNKTADLSPNIRLVIFNVDNLNTLIKRKMLLQVSEP